MKGFKEVSSLSLDPLALDSQTWGYTFTLLSSATRVLYIKSLFEEALL